VWRFGMGGASRCQWAQAASGWIACCALSSLRLHVCKWLGRMRGGVGLPASSLLGQWQHVRKKRPEAWQALCLQPALKCPMRNPPM
jgi:hypothetical protein